MVGRRVTSRRVPWDLVVVMLSVLVLFVAANLATLYIFKPNPEVRTSTRTVTVTTTLPAPAPPARALKPLQDLVPGDHVLYDALDGRPRCLFINWLGDTTQATVKCPGLPQLTVETAYLTPVEDADVAGVVP